MASGGTSISNLRLTAVTLGVTFVVLHREDEDPAEVARDVLGRGPDGLEIEDASAGNRHVTQVEHLPPAWKGAFPYVSPEIPEDEASERTCAEWILALKEQADATR